MSIDVERHEEDHTYRVIFSSMHDMNLFLGGIKLYRSVWLDKASDSDSPQAYDSIAMVIGNMAAEMELDASEEDNGKVVCRFSDAEMTGILKTMITMMALEMNEPSRQKK